MPAEQGNYRNKVKRLALLGLLTAVCLVIGYLESIVNLSFIAPGIKPGLSNSIACVLVFSKDTRGAVAVNLTRILLSALLFGSLISLAFALAGGALSLLVMILLRKSRAFSAVGASAAGGALHNAAQCAVGTVFVGAGVVYYLPLLLILGVACGAAVGFLSKLILKRVGKSEKNV